MTDPDPTARPPTLPVPRGEGAAVGGKDLLTILATPEPIDEEFPDFDAAQETLRDVDWPGDQECGSEPGRR